MRLMPSRKIFVPTPPKPKPILDKDGKPRGNRQVTDINKNTEEFAYDEAIKHYEQMTGRSLTRYPSVRRKLRDMVARAANMAVKR